MKTHRKWSDSEYILRGEPRGFPDGFDVHFERKKEVKDNFKISCLEQVEERGCQQVDQGVQYNNPRFPISLKRV